MSRFWHFLLFLGFILMLCGCAGGSEIAEDPTRLSGVNRALEGHSATIVWHSGETLKNAAWVQISPDSVRYRRYTDPGGASRWEHPPPPQTDEKTRSRPIRAVQRIEAHVGGGALTGFAIGAVPGGILVAASLVVGIRQDCGESSSQFCGLGPVLGLYWGAIGALVGGLVGAIIGELADQDRRVVYHRPVEKYLDH